MALKQDFSRIAQENTGAGLQTALNSIGAMLTSNQVSADRQKVLDLEAARNKVLDDRYTLQAEWDAKAHTQQESEWKTANAKAADALLVKERVDALNKNYIPSANASIKGVEDYINNQSVADIESGKAYGKVDGTPEQQAQHAKFSAATNIAYEAAAPTKEEAYSEMAGKYMAAGASPTDADALAKIKVAGLQSSEEQRAASQKLADDTLTHSKWSYEQYAKRRGEDVAALAKSSKNSTSGGGSGENSYTGGNVLGALTKAGIKDEEAQTVVGEIARFKAEEGYTDSQIALAIPLAAETAGWVSDPDIQTKILKNIVRQNYGVRSVDTNGNETWAAAKGSTGSKFSTGLADIDSKYAALQTLPSMQSPVSSAKTADQIKAEFLKNYLGDTTKIGGVVDGVPGHAATNANREKELNSAADTHTKAMVSKQDMAMYVADAAKATGLSGDVIQSIIGKESGGDANASNPNSSASGLGQFTNATKAGIIKQFSKSHGLTEDNFNDPKNNVLALALLLDQNTTSYIREYGRQPTPGEQYGMHFLGFGGFSKFNKELSADPSTSIAAVVSADTMNSNPNLYGSDKKPLTLEAVQNMFNSKMPTNNTGTSSDNYVRPEIGSGSSKTQEDIINDMKTRAYNKSVAEGGSIITYTNPITGVPESVLAGVGMEDQGPVILPAARSAGGILGKMSAEDIARQARLQSFLDRTKGNTQVPTNFSSSSLVRNTDVPLVDAASVAAATARRAETVAGYSAGKMGVGDTERQAIFKAFLDRTKGNTQVPTNLDSSPRIRSTDVPFADAASVAAATARRAQTVADYAATPLKRVPTQQEIKNALAQRRSETQLFKPRSKDGRRLKTEMQELEKMLKKYDY